MGLFEFDSCVHENMVVNRINQLKTKFCAVMHFRNTEVNVKATYPASTNRFYLSPVRCSACFKRRTLGPQKLVERSANYLPTRQFVLINVFC